MDHAWQVLRRAGVPLSGEPRDGRAPSTTEIAGAVHAAIAGSPTGRAREALSAFLFAWRHGWPRAFVDAFNGDADRVLAWAAGGLQDGDRYLKLRRIAIANLATVL